MIEDKTIKEPTEESRNHKGKNYFEKYIYNKSENDDSCYHKNEDEKIEAQNEENEEGIMDLKDENIVTLEEIDEEKEYDSYIKIHKDTFKNLQRKAMYALEYLDKF